MCRSSKSLDCRGFDWCSLAVSLLLLQMKLSSTGSPSKINLIGIRSGHVAVSVRSAGKHLHRGYSHYLLTVKGQMIPGLVVKSC